MKFAVLCLWSSTTAYLPLLVISSRLLLAVVLVAAGIGKLLDPVGFRQALADFGVPPGRLERAARTLPFLEIILSIGILIDQSSRISALFTGLLLTAFSLAMSRLLQKKLQPPCHCFGAFHSRPIGVDTLARTAACVLLCILISTMPRADFIRGLHTSLLAAATAVLLATALYWSARRGLVKMSKLQRLKPGQTVLGLGRREYIKLEKHLASTIPTLLLLTSEQCSECHRLEAELASWARTIQNELPIVRLVRQSECPGGEVVCLESEAWASLLLPTPGAVLVSPEGIVLATPVAGVEQIVVFVRTLLKAS